MSVSKIDICNMALAHLGMKGITSITENNPSAIACNTFFVPSRDDVLGETNWTFAKASEPLVLSTEEVLGWSYIYSYPVKATTVWDVFNEATASDKGKQEFEVVLKPAQSSRLVCSDLSFAYADYTYQLSDTGLYTPKFIISLSYRLAAMMAHTLVRSTKVGLELTQVYAAALSEAKRINGSEKKRKPKQNSCYQDSRA